MTQFFPFPFEERNMQKSLQQLQNQDHFPGKRDCTTPLQIKPPKLEIISHLVEFQGFSGSISYYVVETLNELRIFAR